jgi:DhnA family fructose-bisphosphate aldolase class Ia
MVQKSLDRKLQAIHADPHGCKEFILADAKDADMALAIGAPGKSPEAHSEELRYRSLAEFREIIEQIVEQGLVDIMLMSASTSEVLAIQKRIFDKSSVTPAARVNDTTDIHILRGSKYATQPSLPFRTTTLDHIQCGHVDCRTEERSLGANLGLYSLTFNNDSVLDRETLEQYNVFRLEAERKGFRHFLEVFDPNQPEAVNASRIPEFINDAIVRALGGVTSAGRPLFLKMVYHGPQAMEELVHYDPHLVVGILGGSAGTTYDAFKLLSEAKKYGARVALFGRKINNAENQLAFIHFLRLIADSEITAEEAVHAYHGVLQRLGIQPLRSLEEDMQLQTSVMSYDGSKKGTQLISAGQNQERSASRPARLEVSREHCACGCGSQCGTRAKHTEFSAITYPDENTAPDFATMTPAQKIAFHKRRWDRILG